MLAACRLQTSVLKRHQPVLGSGNSAEHVFVVGSFARTADEPEPLAAPRRPSLGSAVELKCLPICFQVRSQRQGGALSGEDQALELRVRPRIQTDFGKRVGRRRRRASRLPPRLVAALLERRGARAAGAVWRAAVALRTCRGDPTLLALELLRSPVSRKSVT